MEIIFHDFANKESYDGTQIHPLWALHKFEVMGDTIVIFRGSMSVPKEEMIDVKDIVREQDLADILISSDDCIHFIIEMFDDQPANLKVAYHRLHLLSFIVQRVLEQELSISIRKEGTDLYYNDQKMNVGIATCSSTSSKIHFGLNIISTGVPKYVKAIGLHEIKKDLKLEELAMKIADDFKFEIESIDEDVMKSRTF
jgi:hypothetical protein